ncbi:DNA-binding transcriptional regulator YhcF (GntR family) [Haloferula luteola]|uniref:DNA-binding transcriptional regulator YhcF (GntR family) n=1 Tax=Haloferula luteola TaxID=595692 RepID=A0A840UWV9_9BACT|nr:DNA-binding transcriptional regulator YhcF (GntR family) [Haloferula luteola]
MVPEWVMLPFVLQLRDGEPVSDQVVRAAHRALANGELREGDLFPSVRGLAQELKISPTTAFKVVQELKDLGFLVSRPGVGMVVQAPQLPPVEKRQALLEPAARRFLEEARALHLTAEETEAVLRRLSDPDSEIQPERW